MATAALASELDRVGAERMPGAIGSALLARLDRAFPPAARPGARLRPDPALGPLLEATDAVAEHILGSGARPVRALLLDKNPGSNWSLGWHQDRVIAVRERRNVPGFSGWTVKAGIDHAEPPFDLIEHMLTLRVHLDDSGPNNGPLLIAPRSHQLGRVPKAEIGAAVERLGILACPAAAGDIWVYRAPILHASARAASPSRRRVLQLSYSADALPGGLEWLGA
jgi:hypothetical protein